MKKFLALLISVIMVLSMFSVMALPSFADEEEDKKIDPMEWINNYIQTVNGDWYARRTAGNIGKEDDYTPAGGYHYDSEGFHAISPDYSNMTPSYTITSKDTYNLKEGFTMTFRIDDFAYNGGVGSDAWITVMISDTPLSAPSDTTYGRGSGWTPLIRGAGNGSAECQSFWTGIKNEDGTGGEFTHYGNTATTCDMDGDKELYTLDVSWDGSAYTIKLNGVTIAGNGTVSKKLDELCPDGNFYISISCHSTIVASPFSASILSVNGSTPTGNDNVEPDENCLVYGDLIDASTVPTNQPALLFDASKTSFWSDPDMQNCDVVPNGDNSYTVISRAGVSFLTWTVKKSLTYNAEDFPYFAMLVKNLPGANGGLYVQSGEHVGSDPATNLVNWDIYDYDEDEWTREWEDEDGIYWNLIVVDLTNETLSFENSGRIHGCRIDFNSLDTTGEDPFDLMYMGYFRSEAEAQAYGEEYLAKAGLIGGSAGDEETDEATDVATDPATDVATDEATDAATDAATDVATGDATTAETKADATDAATAAAEEEGCSSVIGAGAAALVLSAMAAAVALRKKH